MWNSTIVAIRINYDVKETRGIETIDLKDDHQSSGCNAQYFTGIRYLVLVLVLVLVITSKTKTIRLDDNINY
jgi:hypothetical protein